MNTFMVCRGNRQYLLTCKVSRYFICPLPLHDIYGVDVMIAMCDTAQKPSKHEALNQCLVDVGLAP